MAAANTARRRSAALAAQLAPPEFGRATFRAFERVQTRWSDVDVYGHVNNVQFYSFMDTAVNQILVREGGLDTRAGPVLGVVAESHCRYLREAGFPQDLDVGVRVGRLGSSSVRYELGIFDGAAGAPEDPLAAGQFVHVFVDRASRRPVPIPPRLRRCLERLSDEFAAAAKSYASFRPVYPPALLDALVAAYDAGPGAEVPRAAARALDVGAGSGQMAAALAARGFGTVRGVDKSARQLAEADRSTGAEYGPGTDADTGAAAGSVHLLSAAQAAHWFDLPRFYREARRVAAPAGGGALLALSGYGLVRVLEPAPLDEVFRRYYDSFEGHWPGACDRRLLVSGFEGADPPLPFRDTRRQWFHEPRDTTAGAFLGYLRSWSAYNSVVGAGGADPLPAFEAELRRALGSDSDDAPMRIEWPFWLVTARV